MALVSYVARRMLDEVCEIATPIDPRYEPTFQELYDWFELYTDQYGGRVYFRLPEPKQCVPELCNDMVRLYAGIFGGVGDEKEALVTVRSLFTVSFYMMIKYRDSPSLCSNIPLYFELISKDLNGWRELRTRL